jgi:hypothetical protein
MNRKIALSLVLAAAAAGKTFAGDATMAGDILVDPAFTPALTRAEVVADLQHSGAAWSQEAGTVADFHGDRSRADVTAEYLAERGTVQAMNGEDSGSMFLAQHEPGRRSATRVLAQKD